MEKSVVFRPVENKVAEMIISPAIRDGVKTMLQSMPYTKKGRQLMHKFDCLLGLKERQFVTQSVRKAARFSVINFETSEVEGEFRTQVLIVKG